MERLDFLIERSETCAGTEGGWHERQAYCECGRLRERRHGTGSYTNASDVYVDLDVIDLDVSSYPDDGETDEADLNQKRIDEIESDPSWRAIY